MNSSNDSTPDLKLTKLWFDKHVENMRDLAVEALSPFGTDDWVKSACLRVPFPSQYIRERPAEMETARRVVIDSILNFQQELRMRYRTSGSGVHFVVWLDALFDIESYRIKEHIRNSRRILDVTDRAVVFALQSLIGEFSVIKVARIKERVEWARALLQRSWKMALAPAHAPHWRASSPRRPLHRFVAFGASVQPTAP